MEIWDIYTKDRVKTGRTIVRGEKLAENDYHLVVHIWFINSKGEYLIQKRASHLGWMPNMWAATGGAVVAGEDSLLGAMRETEEELGLKIPIEHFKLLFTQIRGQDISDIYLATLDTTLSEIVFDREAISEIAYVSKAEVEKMIENKTFVNYGEEYFSGIGF